MNRQLNPVFQSILSPISRPSKITLETESLKAEDERYCRRLKELKNKRDIVENSISDSRQLDFYREFFDCMIDDASEDLMRKIEVVLDRKLKEISEG